MGQQVSPCSLEESFQLCAKIDPIRETIEISLQREYMGKYNS